MFLSCLVWIGLYGKYSALKVVGVLGYLTFKGQLTLTRENYNFSLEVSYRGKLSLKSSSSYKKLRDSPEENKSSQNESRRGHDTLTFLDSPLYVLCLF